nr:hypothetical protein [Thiorhodospira sibirica]
MSHKEIDRLEMIQAVANKHLRQAEAAQRRGVERAPGQAPGSPLS